MTWEWVLVIGEVLIFLCVVMALQMSHKLEKDKWEEDKRIREDLRSERKKQLT